MFPRRRLSENRAVRHRVDALRIIETRRFQHPAREDVVALIAQAAPHGTIVDTDAGKPVARIACPRHYAAEVRYRRVDARPLQVELLQADTSALPENRRLQLMCRIAVAAPDTSATSCCSLVSLAPE